MGQPVVRAPRIWQPLSVLNDVIYTLKQREAGLKLQSYKLPSINNRYDDLVLVKQSHICECQHPIYFPFIPNQYRKNYPADDNFLLSSKSGCIIAGTLDLRAETNFPINSLRE